MKLYLIRYKNKWTDKVSYKEFHILKYAKQDMKNLKRVCIKHNSLGEIINVYESCRCFTELTLTKVEEKLIDKKEYTNV
jgi:hypothetical protein